MRIVEKEALGKFVERRRKALRLTQTELASYVGYSPQAFSKFEAGKLSISLLVGPSLANALGLSLDDLLARRENPTDIVNKPLDPQIISLQLAFFRNARGLSQEEFAQKALASVRSIRSYELGDSLPTLNFIDRLIETFGIEASHILYPNPMMMNTELAASIRSGQVKAKKKKQLYSSLLGLFSVFVIGSGVTAGISMNQAMVKATPDESISASKTIEPDSGTPIVENVVDSLSSSEK